MGSLVDLIGFWEGGFGLLPLSELVDRGGQAEKLLGLRLHIQVLKHSSVAGSEQIKQYK